MGKGLETFSAITHGRASSPKEDAEAVSGLTRAADSLFTFLDRVESRQAGRQEVGSSMQQIRDGADTLDRLHALAGKMAGGNSLEAAVGLLNQLGLLKRPDEQTERPPWYVEAVQNRQLFHELAPMMGFIPVDQAHSGDTELEKEKLRINWEKEKTEMQHATFKEIASGLSEVAKAFSGDGGGGEGGAGGGGSEAAQALEYRMQALEQRHEQLGGWIQQLVETLRRDQSEGDAVHESNGHAT